MKYSNYLRTEYWKDRRRRFKRKTYVRCYICRGKKNLETHHKRYKWKGQSVLFNERHQDLRLLCRDCHRKLHKLGLEEQFAKNLVKRRVLRDFLKRL